MQLPDAKPCDDPDHLFRLQNELMTMAEAILGPRDSSIPLAPPRFVDDGPYIEMAFTSSDFIWRAALSRSAEEYWRFAVFQLAHETIHLLNPQIGDGNYLEEGIAVEFSLRIQPRYNINIVVNLQVYKDALELVWQLPVDSLSAAKRIRESVGSLNVGKVTAQDLEKLFPDVDKDILIKLVAPFPHQLGQTRVDSN